MKKKASIPHYHDADDGPLMPEQIAENMRMSADTLAALNVAFDLDMSMAEALAFVVKNRQKFEAIAAAIVEDQSIADAARTIKALALSSTSAAGKANQGKTKGTSRFKKEEPTWRKEAEIALVRNAELDVEGIADAIKEKTQTKRAIAELRKWVKKHEEGIREKASKRRKDFFDALEMNARKATRRTLSR